MKSLYTQRQALLRSILREARIAAGITQQQLCKRLKRNRNFVSAIERGSHRLDAVELIEYCEALGLDPQDVLGQIR